MAKDLPVAFNYPQDISKFTSLKLSLMGFPATLSKGDPFGDPILFFHLAGIVNDDGYTCRFRSFKITVCELTIVDSQIEETEIGVILSETLPETGQWSASIVNYCVSGVDGTRLPLEEPYGKPGTSSYQAYYAWASWGSKTIPDWIEILQRGSEPQYKVYRFRPEAVWNLYRNGALIQSVATDSNYHENWKAYVDWEVALMPPPPYPSMIIDDPNSYFPTQIEHDQPFDTSVKAVIQNSVSEAEGTAFLDIIYKGKRIPIATHAVSGQASFEYSPAGLTIESLLGKTFTETTFITSAELKFVTGYIDDSGQKQQTNEWLRGINVVVSGGNGEEPQPEEEPSLLDKLAMPAVVISGIAAAIGGAVMLFQRRR